MTQEQMTHRRLAAKYPPSEPCGCSICLQFCRRPGWWTVDEATRAINAGYASRMMLELSPDLSFGVLSPAFVGCEGGVALQELASGGCSFLKANRCELHGTGFQPLECRFCRHDRVGQGRQCHLALEADWHSTVGQALIGRWADLVGLGPSPGSAG